MQGVYALLHEKCAAEGSARSSRLQQPSPPIHGIVNNWYPASLEDFRAATATRAATIRTHYLLGLDGQPLPIVNDLQEAA